MDKDEKFKLIINIRNEQRVLNRKYEQEGLTDEILNKQIELNTLRNEHDITDDLEEKLYEDFVQ